MGDVHHIILAHDPFKFLLSVRVSIAVPDHDREFQDNKKKTGRNATYYPRVASVLNA